MSRQDIRPVFQRCPRLILVVAMFALGLPVHIGRGIIGGAMDGLRSWAGELREVWRLDQKPVTEKVVRDRVRQNRKRLCNSFDCTSLGRCNAFDAETECPVWQAKGEESQ